MTPPTIPAGSLVLLVGPSGAGKSTWASALVATGQLPSTAVISSDEIRTRLFDTDEVQSDHETVFDILHTTVAARLRHGNTTVVDATNLLPAHRAALTALATAAHATTVAVRFAADLDTLREHNAARSSARPDRALIRHHAQMQQHGKVKHLATEVDTVLEHTDEVVVAGYGRTVRSLPGTGKIAVIGDVHGSAEKFAALLDAVAARHPDARLVSVGDIGDRGPDSPRCYQLLFDHQVELISSNHGAALAKKVAPLLDAGMDANAASATLTRTVNDADAAGKPQPMTAFVAATVAQFADVDDGTARLAAAVRAEQHAPFQLHAHAGTVVIVHGGVRPELLGRRDNEARQVALFGTPTGQDPATGFPLGRDSWVDDYNAAADTAQLPLVVYGHIVYPTPRVEARTLGIDTGAGKDPAAPVTVAVIDDGALVDMLSV